VPFDPRASLTRREALAAMGTLGLAVVAGCSSGSSSDSASRDRRSTNTRPGTTAAGSTGSAAPAAPAAGTTCTLAPEVTQGPFYLTDHPNTSNLVQDRPGRTLALTLTVVDTKCAAVAGAKVDVWHCDATGVYGGIGNGTGGGPGGGDFGAARRGTPDTWLQGYQTTAADGVVRFTTIYPGWYPGRAVHIHMKVFAGGSSVHTGQLFFPDAMSATVFQKSPYRGAPDTTNRADSIFTSAGSAALLAPQPTGDGFTATAQLVVRT
jgi:protocatechuate 3,4-dioxygenase beta subunit